LNPRYSIVNFIEDIKKAIPELTLYTSTLWDACGSSDYDRTLGALHVLYCMLRVDLDGKEAFVFGVDANGAVLKEPQDQLARKWEFYKNMNWGVVLNLLVRADLLRTDVRGKLELRQDRVVAMFVMIAVHRVMKNTTLMPTVSSQHAPYQGYSVGQLITQEDVALSYILEFFPALLPSYLNLEPGQRAPILFTVGKMGFNHGWFVQGEAPPGLLFSKIKQVLARGRASQADISFKFIHWFADLGGAESLSKRWSGAEKFTSKFPVEVIGSFFDSFSFVVRLATRSEVQVMEEYLASRWHARGLHPLVATSDSNIAIHRLTLMAQGFEHEAVAAFFALHTEDRFCLTEELARTGQKEQFECAPDRVKSPARGPALLLHYAPALIQKAGKVECVEAMIVLAAVYRAVRQVFPCKAESMEKNACIRMDELKVLKPSEIAKVTPWHVSCTGELDAEVIAGELPEGLQFPSLTARVDLYSLCMLRVL